MYGEVEDFGEGLEDIDFSTMASATSLEGRTMGRSISSTSIKIGPGKEVTELRLRSATICAAAMQHMKRPGLVCRTCYSAFHSFRLSACPDLIGTVPIFGKMSSTPP